ncbi:MAG: hypothetical protein ACD_79C01416G0009, partial [uncultured bacterium]
LDEELSEAVSLIHQVYEAGVDGVIIQDMGLLECNLPPIPLIASTQTYANSLEKVRFFEEIGFKRVILPRELSPKEIRSIRDGTKSIELECFVHGALCVSYSGQCYLSYALGGRSGNRGECAQPCRKKYLLSDSNGKEPGNKYWLSLKDLNRSDFLRELMDAGVSSFKIEGRLKGKEYVANVVSFYRKRLDDILEEHGEKTGECFNIPFKPNLNKTFNRGYTSFFGKGIERKAGSCDTPKMKGEILGTVLKKEKEYVILATKEEIHPGDGICFFDKNNDLCGTRVDRVSGDRIWLQKQQSINVGMQLYRNLDYVWVQKVLKGKIERKIFIRMRIKMSQEKIVLSIKDSFGCEVEVCEEGEFVKSENPVKMSEQIQANLSKTGDTEFFCKEILSEGDDIFFMPVAKLNDLRRRGIEALRKIRERRREKADWKIKQNDVPYPQKIMGFEGNVLNSKAEDFYKRHKVETLERGAEIGLNMHGQKVMKCRYCILAESGSCLLMKTKKDFKEPFFLVDDQGNKLRLAFDCKNCEMVCIY